mmetsp:Transcript_2314/g.6998  ORF Transcript_2314/g.6998 Transcript_2314/m.6998 type:complete len:356 (+) Transcript_2314:1138-2205(+)
MSASSLGSIAGRAATPSPTASSSGSRPTGSSDMARSVVLSPAAPSAGSSRAAAVRSCSARGCAPCGPPPGAAASSYSAHAAGSMCTGRSWLELSRISICTASRWARGACEYGGPSRQSASSRSQSCSAGSDPTSESKWKRRSTSGLTAASSGARAWHAESSGKWRTNTQSACAICGGASEPASDIDSGSPPSPVSSAYTASRTCESSASGSGARLHSSRHVRSSAASGGAGRPCCAVSRALAASCSARRGRRREQAAARPSGTMARSSWQSRSGCSESIFLSTARIILWYAGACASPSEQKAQRQRAVSEAVSTCSIETTRSMYAMSVRGSRTRSAASAQSESRNCAASSNSIAS